MAATMAIIRTAIIISSKVKPRHLEPVLILVGHPFLTVLLPMAGIAYNLAEVEVSENPISGK